MTQEKHKELFDLACSKVKSTEPDGNLLGMNMFIAEIVEWIDKNFKEKET